MDRIDLKTRLVAVKIIREVLVFKKPFKSTFAKHLNDKSLSLLDIRFITEISKGTIRMSKRMRYEISNHYNGKFNKLEDLYIVILEIGVYQLDYMSNVPSYAAVSTSVDITKIFFPKYSSLTNALLRNMLSNRADLKKPTMKNSIEYLSIYYSHPEWLVNKWLKEYAFKSLIKLLEYNNTVPETWFRYDFNKIKNIEEKLKVEEIEFKKHDYLEDFFITKNPSFFLNNSIFESSGISVQSLTNGLIVKLLDPLKDEKIIDLCAAPGGKTISISDKMVNSGQIIAYDINNKRTNLIRQNLDKNKITNVKIEIKDSSEDKIECSSKMIADVPCLGTGTISKNVDLRWKKNLNDLSELTNLQERILNNSTKYLEPNGVIVYSTCSIEEEENWMVVDSFIEKHPNYIIDNAEKYVDCKFTDSRGAINVKPQTHGIDGGFAVRLINYEN